MRLFPLTALFTLALAPPAAAQVSFTVMGPGRALDVSADGQAVVGVDPQGAFLWTLGAGYQPLGGYGAIAVSDDGSVVLGDFAGPGGNYQAGRWTAASGWVPLGGLPGQTGGFVSTGEELSADGAIAVGMAFSANSVETGFLWTPAAGISAIAQGPVPSGLEAISRDGRWIGGWDEPSSIGPRAALWGPGLQQQLILEDPQRNPMGLGQVFGVSSDGTWAVGSGVTAVGTQHFRYSAASGVQYFDGPLNGAGTFGDCVAVSDDGSVAVGFRANQQAGAWATLWTPAGGLVTIDDHLASFGLGSASGWNILEANAVTPDGMIVVGSAAPVGMSATSWFIAQLWTGEFGTSFCSAVANSTGGVGELTARGSARARDNRVELLASGLPQNQFGIFIVSRIQGFVPGPGISSNGNLCLGGQIGRFVDPGQLLSSSSSGSFSLAIDLTAIPIGGMTVSAIAGDQFHFQAWHRDTVGLGSNFTEGLQLDFH